MKKIRKAIIPAAGLGTRMLPATKAIPKEMLPVIDKPVIQYVVEECVRSGIEEIIIVKTPDKNAIVNHFSKNESLEKHLENSNKLELLETVKKISNLAKFHFVDQVGPYGNGTPVLCAEKYIGDDPFAVIWGDEFIYATPPRLAQAMEIFEKYDAGAVISGIKIPNKKDLSKYGIAKVESVENSNNVYKLLEIVEKPNPDEAPSNLATHGAYLFKPNFYKYLKSTEVGKSNELWLVDAINALMKDEPIYTFETKNAEYYDTGNKFSYLRTNIEFALRYPEIKDQLIEYLKTKI